MKIKGTRERGLADATSRLVLGDPLHVRSGRPSPYLIDTGGARSEKSDREPSCLGKLKGQKRATGWYPALVIPTRDPASVSSFLRPNERKCNNALCDCNS